jgi:hypothetical protein
MSIALTIAGHAVKVLATCCQSAKMGHKNRLANGGE